MSSARETVVIGAGPVGCLWAAMLKELGIPAQVYEKRSSEQQGNGRSVNLVLTSRGINALKKIGLWSQLRPLTTPVYGRMIHSLQGDLSYWPYGRNEQECNYSISRGELNQFLQQQVMARGVPLHFGQTLEQVNLTERTTIFQNGASCSFQQLFAADGGGSAVRHSLQLQPEKFQINSQRFPVEYKEMLMPANADGQYAMKPHALHIWPRGREMLMALPNCDGSFTATLFMPQKNFTDLDNDSKIQAHLERHYPDALPLIPDYLYQYNHNPRGSFGTVRCSPWAWSDALCLLGDAAHAIVPFFGQGLNCGLEDCSLLYDLWQRRQSWKQVFQEYDHIQRPNGDAIATMAIENYFEMADRVGDEKFFLRKQIEHKIEATFPQLYRSRYGMVTYTLIPYHLAYGAGKIQDEILSELLEITPTAEELDMGQAKELIQRKLSPFLQNHRLSLESFKT